MVKDLAASSGMAPSGYSSLPAVAMAARGLPNSPSGAGAFRSSHRDIFLFQYRPCGDDVVSDADGNTGDRGREE